MRVRRSLDPRYSFGGGGDVLFIGTRRGANTFRALIGFTRPIRCAATSFERFRLFRRYTARVVVMSDVERITGDDEDRLSHLFNYWSRDGRHGPLILNRPPRTLRRYALLKELYRRGINKRNIFRLDEPQVVDEVRFPCFIRTENEHWFGKTPRILNSRDDIIDEVRKLEDNGLTLYGKIVCELADTREHAGHYVKYSYLKIGDHIIPAHRYAGTEWFLKHYHADFIDAYPDTLAEEERFLEEQWDLDVVRQVFDIAGMDYGRIDYGRCPDGGIHVFEVNTAPNHLNIRQVNERRKSNAMTLQGRIRKAFAELVDGREKVRLNWPRGYL